MAYDYEQEKNRLFTDEGQRVFLSIRDKVKEGLKQTGAVMIARYMEGDSWISIACFDRMVELGELRELTDQKKEWGQHRVFVAIERTA